MSYPIPTEAQEQQVLIEYLELKGYKFTAIPNETGHTAEHYRRAVRMKRSGVRKGFPDLVVIAGDTFMAIELKRLKGSSTSQEQKDWIDTLNAVGVPAKVCKGASEAIDFIEKVKAGV